MKNVEVRQIRAGEFLSLIKSDPVCLIKNVTEEQACILEKAPYSYSILVNDQVVACAGVTEYWAGRGEAWAVLDQKCKMNFLTIHNVVKRFLFICPVKRIEAAVDCDFVAGNRWVKALGFKLEVQRLECFFPNGRPATLYSRIA